jgi:2-succinyl-5-enolpyruvyl-6-hydroxy-3-cyclohexene-1-carboxylate synthase
MVTSSKINVQLIVQQCLEQGMKHVVCSPGSRNAPLVIAFDEHPEIQCSVIHDERSAAFFALGMAQQLDQPIGIVCTSGSAALNYYPAIAEARSTP